MKRLSIYALAFLLTSSLNADEKYLIIKEQGSFAVGGSVVKSAGKYTALPKEIASKSSNEFFESYKASVKAGGQTLHADHASVFYQIPKDAKAYPMVFLHGYGQSARGWISTPDGRDSFGNIFLKRGFATYLVDQPRRGQAAKSSVDAMIKANPDEQFWYTQFRIGTYPNVNQGVAFDVSPSSLEQFYRQMTPDTGSFDIKVINDSLVKLFDKTKDAIFLTHSAGSVVGWMVATKTDKVKAIVAFEPGAPIFSQDEAPAKIESKFGDVAPVIVSKDEFMKLTKIPIIIYFGDFIPEYMDGTQGGEMWHSRLEMSRKFVELINKHDGNASLIELPKIGIRGNTHFIFSDLNNVEIANHLSTWLKAQGLDK